MKKISHWLWHFNKYFSASRGKKCGVCTKTCSLNVKIKSVRCESETIVPCSIYTPDWNGIEVRYSDQLSLMFKHKHCSIGHSTGLTFEKRVQTTPQLHGIIKSMIYNFWILCLCRVQCGTHFSTDKKQIIAYCSINYTFNIY